MSFITGVTNVPCMADTIIVRNEDLDCKGVDFGGRNVIIENTFEGNHQHLEYLVNGKLLNEQCILLFNNDKKLRTFDLDCEKLVNGYQMFYNCVSLENVNLHNMINLQEARTMFCNCQSLKEVNIESMSSVTSCNYMFADCVSLSSITIGNLDNLSASKLQFLASNMNQLQKVKIGNIPLATTMNDYFRFFITYSGSNCSYLTDLELGDMVNLTMFNAFTSSNYIKDLKNFTIGDIRNVTAMTTSFKYMQNLETLKIGKAPTGTVNMDETFCGCSKLSSLSALTTKVQPNTLNATFSGCSLITDEEIKNAFDLSKLTLLTNGVFAKTAVKDVLTKNCSLSSASSFSNLYESCNGLTNVDLGTIENIEDFENCFSDCSNLTSITMNTPKARYVNKMFADSGLKKFYAENWGYGTNSGGALQYSFSPFLYCPLEEFTMLSGRINTNIFRPLSATLTSVTLGNLDVWDCCFDSGFTASTVRILSASGEFTQYFNLQVNRSPTFYNQSISADTFIFDKSKIRTFNVTYSAGTKPFTLEINPLILNVGLNFTIENGTTIPKIKSNNYDYITSYSATITSTQTKFALQSELTNINDLYLNHYYLTELEFVSNSVENISLVYRGNATNITIEAPNSIGTLYLSGCSNATSMTIDMRSTPLLSSYQIGQYQLTKLKTLDLKVLVPTANDNYMWKSFSTITSCTISVGVNLRGGSVNTYFLTTSIQDYSFVDSLMNAIDNNPYDGDSGTIYVTTTQYNKADARGYIERMKAKGYTLSII